MTAQTVLHKGPAILAEIKEFGSFDHEAQHYIRRSLDVAFAREFDADRWVRNEEEAASLVAQRHIYRALAGIRKSIPGNATLTSADSFLFPLIAVSAFDVGGGCLTSFCEYRFLYERLLSPEIRPWLPSAFAAAAAMPHGSAHSRDVLLASLLGAMSQGWSRDAPAFYPGWLAN